MISALGLSGLSTLSGLADFGLRRLAQASPVSPASRTRQQDSIRQNRRDTDATGLRLSEEDRKLVQQLKDRDREVRTHEQAHKSAGGHYAGGTQYTTQQGPDNRPYAIGGEVNIDTSPVPGNPEATIRKAQQIRRAALAPSEPSAQDRNVAATAAQMENSARMEKATAAYRGNSPETGMVPWVAGAGLSLYV